MLFRTERPGDIEKIKTVTRTAFAGVPQSNGAEVAIIDALRAAGALSLSLVVEDMGRVIGHLAASPVGLGDRDYPWYAIGPVSIAPPRQGEGIGEQLVREGLRRLHSTGAGGCVLVGDPAFYGRFGFQPDPSLTFRGAPSDYLQSLVFSGPMPEGEVGFHSAFDLDG